ncbi:DUF6461 domain-containing protein [Streptomyces sp. NPDC002248]
MAAGADPRAHTWAAAWMCVTLTRGLDAAQVLSRYGADPARARPLDADAASDLLGDEPPSGEISLLRAGRIGDIAFCVEEEGAVGIEDDVLARLSLGTETWGVSATDGMEVFQHWRDGGCVEYFEPGMEHTRAPRPGPWWNRVREALLTPGYEDLGMAPAVALVLDHLGVTLDDTTLAGLWPTLTLPLDDESPEPLRDSYAGEGPVPPHVVVRWD